MKCREFRQDAGSLTLVELSRTGDAQLLAHATGCESCGAWLRKQRALAASMQALQAQTASLQAGPDVERALLRAFRQAIPAIPAASPSSPQVAISGMRQAHAGMTERSNLTVAVPVSTPFALRLSRWFEIGAYVASAAAVVVLMFLGLRLLQQRGAAAPLASQSSPATVAAPVQQPMSANTAATGEHGRRTAGQQRLHPAGSAGEIAAQESQADADDGYVALMLCDPLSCSSETQVVRMELPAPQGGQPQIADVVVGYDGLVRAVRIVQ
ncbi:MAG TPA: hypothetical protein VL240_07065 [Candidatus Binatia bacterium]|nr:hypothetical protein [Candidatus Binatia bacterium]